MRLLSAVATMFLAVAFVAASEESAIKVEVQGPHICCKQCINIVAKILGAVDGVSAVKSDIKSKTITFTAKTDTAAKAGVQALLNGGFYGKATADGKAMEFKLAADKPGKADTVSIKDVHVCCGQCVTGVKDAFPGLTVTITGKGVQKTVTVEKPATPVLETLRKAGFNGTVVEK